MNKVIFGSKPSGETKKLVFDFASSLAVGETISSASVVATTYSGTDSSPSSIISGSDTTSGSQVTQAVTAGTVGVTYLLTCTAITSASQTLQLAGYLVVL